VDLSSDGMSNNGPAPQDIYSASLLHGINVNALVIVQTGRDDGAPAERSQYRQYRRLVGWFDREVLHGPHAFSIVADGFDDFERAMRAKLLRELELPAVTSLPVSGSAG
jgi:hypothetical protein